MSKVFITRKIPEVAQKILREAGFEVEISNYDGILPREKLFEKTKGVDAVLSLFNDKLDDELIKTAGSQLKIIANCAVGYDNIDLEAAEKRNVIVTNTPDVSTGSVAEYVIALMLCISRQIIEADKSIRDSKYQIRDSALLLGNVLAGKVLGLIGLGQIGSVVAEKAKNGFGLDVLYFDVIRNKKLEETNYVRYSDLKNLLKQSDFVSIHVPLLSSTHHLIGGKNIRLMKKTAYLINTSRGPVVDEKALMDALKNGFIKGAALDVYENEPEITPGLAELPNTVLTPHIASNTVESLEARAELAAKNIVAVLGGKPPITPVNPHATP